MTTLRERPTDARSGDEERTQRRFRSPLRPHVLSAIFLRDFKGYFINPVGYVFLVLFVVVCSWAQFWQPSFFANNLVSLAPLNEWMPYLLLFFIPAITMSTWAEERKQGTEELLFTLPAQDVEIVLGKYLAALGIYTVALLFLGLGHQLLLRRLGQSDLGVMAANNLGYWLEGAMLIALGMVASIVSANATVGFIVGAVFCALPVFAGLLAAPTSGTTRRFIEGLSVSSQYRDLGIGVAPLSAVLYFVSLAAAMLYVNMVLLGRRHWAGGAESRGRWAHAAVRIVALIVALVSIDVIVQKTLGSWRLDLSEEQVHTLSATSRKLIRAIPKDRPVFIEAYISPEVPREYVQTRLDLINTLNEFAAFGAERIRLNIVETPRSSPEARDAERRYGIKPRQVQTFDEGRFDRSEIILGLAFSSGLEEVVVPFVDRGLPVQYEVARSLRVASGAKRRRVGILSTDAKLMGGMNARSMSLDPDWSVVTELKKQYDVVSIAADAPIPTDLAALVVAQPSSLTQRQIPHLTQYVRAGGPTLLFCDPWPIIASDRDPDLIPSEPKRPAGGMFGNQPPQPKGDLRPFVNMLGVVWPNNEIAWNNYNPHPKYLGGSAKNQIFVGRGATPDAFGSDPTSGGLQEVFLPYPGVLYPLAGARTVFRPLLQTSDQGGTVAYEELTTRTDQGPVFAPDPPLARNHQPLVLAARITGPLPPEAADPFAPDTPTPRDRGGQANVILVADLDLIESQIVDLRLKPVERFDDLNFDNMSFFLNCVDSLAGDETFISLRSRRAKQRTLEAVEEHSRRYHERADEADKVAAADFDAQMKTAQKRLDRAVQETRDNKELDSLTKEATLRNRIEFETKRLAKFGEELKDRKRRRAEDSRITQQVGDQRFQNDVRAWAMLVPPLPILVLAGFVFTIRARRENRGATPGRIA